MTTTGTSRMTRNREVQDPFTSFLDQAAAGTKGQTPAEPGALGGDLGIGYLVAIPDDLLRAVESGFHSEAIDALHALGLGPSETESLIAPLHTLQRRHREELLSRGEAEAALRVARILIHAETTLGSRERALAWLRRSNRNFGDAAPLTLLVTEAGHRRVEDLLLRADLGQMA